ncbi:MAG: hypothetical protein U1A78_09870 [Polyangia bacterium]
MSLTHNTVTSLYLNSDLFRLLAWFIWGALTKLIDLHFDDRKFPPWIAFLACGVCGLTVGIAMLIHHDTFLTYGAIILACILTRKIDNSGFFISVSLVVAVIAAIALRQGIGFELRSGFLALLAFLVFSYCADEWLNDYMDARARRLNEQNRQLSTGGKILHILVAHRNASILLALPLLINGILPFWIVLLSGVFDLGYYAMYGIGQLLSTNDRHQPSLPPPGPPATRLSLTP